jgi:hypothetical protein
MVDKDIDIIKQKYTNSPNLALALQVYNQINNKYPFLELEFKWNEPCFCFQGSPIAYFIEKSKVEKTIFKQKTLFLGIMNGYKMFNSKLFITTNHVHVKYINLNKIKKNQVEELISIIGQAVEIDSE